MLRDTIDFDTFKEHFIDQPDGYFPVYASFEEVDDEDMPEDAQYYKVVELDMICEWRMPDGKVKFIQVPFETKEQLEAIVAYLHVAAGLLHEAISKRNNELLPEAEAEGWWK